MGDIDKRIFDAQDELMWAAQASGVYEWSRSRRDAAQARAKARAEKRLADLIAVRDGLAVEVYATASVNVGGDWISYGKFDAVEQSHEVLYRIFHDSADRLTILRGIARKPVTSVDEADAESEETR